MKNEVKLKNNISIGELLQLTPIETITFPVFIPKVEGKLLVSSPVEINIFKDFLEYKVNYVITQEFVYKADGEDLNIDPLINQTEFKNLKYEDQGVLSRNTLDISRCTDNELNTPGEGTTFKYIIYLNSNQENISFFFESKTKQIEVYNKLIKWRFS
jgi:hypothetical protein